jgi:acyl-CoA reductase-like NAD-dependent aldehyde dehydrogenase
LKFKCKRYEGDKKTEKEKEKNKKEKNKRLREPFGPVKGIGPWPI